MKASKSILTVKLNVIQYTVQRNRKEVSTPHVEIKGTNQPFTLIYLVTFRMRSSTIISFFQLYHTHSAIALFQLITLYSSVSPPGSCYLSDIYLDMHEAIWVQFALSQRIILWMHFKSQIKPQIQVRDNSQNHKAIFIHNQNQKQAFALTFRSKRCHLLHFEYRCNMPAVPGQLHVMWCCQNV